jgi:hypothetical protein
MYAFSADALTHVFGGISDGDAGSGLGYDATSSQIQSNVTTSEQSDVDALDALGNFCAGVWAGL